MNKSELKVGYVVKFRNEKLAMVMKYDNYNNEDNITLVEKDGTHSELTEYNDCLERIDKYDDFKDEYDIVEVYGYSIWCYRALEISTSVRKLLWKKEKRVPMTLEEIENELGYKIKLMPTNPFEE